MADGERLDDLVGGHGNVKVSEEQAGEQLSNHARAVKQMLEGERAMKDTVPAMGDPMLEPMLKFFKYCHLPENLQLISSPFYDLAHELVRSLPRVPERTVALRKLLEAKDCAVRASLP